MNSYDDDDDGDLLPPEADYIPPEDDDDDLPPSVFPSATAQPSAFLALTSHGDSQRASTASPTPRERRQRGNRDEVAGGAGVLGRSSQNATSAMGGGDGDGGQRASRVQHVRKAKALHYTEMSLQASVHHGGTDAPALPSQQMASLNCIASMLASAGCTRSLLHLQRVLPKSLAPKEVNPQSVPDFLTMLNARSAQIGRGWDDESMWPPDPLIQKTVVFATVDDRTKAQGSTAEVLVERLIGVETDPPSLKGKPKINYTNIFLFTFHLFMPMEYLFSILSRMMITCQSEAGHTIGEARALHLQRRLLSILAWIVTQRWSDVTRDVAGRLEAFSASMALRFVLPADIQKGLVNLASLCRSQLTRAGVPPVSRRIDVGVVQDAPPPNMPLDATMGSFLDVEDVELARQICVLSFSLFERIRLRELEHGGWTHDQLKYATHNLVAFVRYTEKTTRWMAWCIVSSPDPDVRRLLYRKLLRVARYLYDMQNYTMLSAVYQALDHNGVTRLSACSTALPKDEEDALDAIRTAMDPFSSILKDVPHTIASATIPMMAPFLSVLSRLEEGHPTFVHGPNGHRMVNWSKMAELGTTLIQFASFQAVPYPFRPIPSIQRFLWVMPGASDDESIMRASKANESGR